MPARKRPSRRPPDGTAAIRAEIRQGFGAVVQALADVARQLEALRAEVTRRPSVRPPKG
jgi:hypothetical protein